jgi:hypothetical protein
MDFLIDYISCTIPASVQTIIIDSESYEVYIYSDSKVTFSNGTVLCAHGNIDCATDWYEAMNTPEIVTQTINNIDYTFYVYLNGTVIF